MGKEELITKGTYKYYLRDRGSGPENDNSCGNN